MSPAASLRGRLNRTLTAMLVVAFLALWLLMSAAIRQFSSGHMLAHLEHDLDAVAAALTVDADRKLTFNRAAVEPVYDSPLSGQYYVVRSGDNVVFQSGSHDQGLRDAVRLAPGDKAHAHTVGPAGEGVLMLSRGVRLAGHEVTISVAEADDDMNSDVRELGLAALGLLLLFLIAVLLVQNYAIRQALQPLDGIRDELRGIANGERDRISGRPPSEIQPLVDEVNRLLVQLQRRLEQSRASTGNLAHTLKTPLTLLMRLAEDTAVPPRTRADLAEQVRLMHGRIDRELKRARFAGSGQAGSLVNLHDEIPVLATLMQRIHAEKNLQIEVAAPDRRLAFDREDVLELLGNLLDNACKWASSQVRVHASAGEEAGRSVLNITVSDDGPGCAQTELERLTQRGHRLDESLAGHGLGLAIVRDLVEVYEGQLKIERDPQLGGLKVSARLGLAPALSAG